MISHFVRSSQIRALRVGIHSAFSYTIILSLFTVTDMSEKNLPSSATKSNMSVTKSSQFSMGTDYLVEVDHKISALEWIMILIAPIINPIIGICLFVSLIKYCVQKKRGNRYGALRTKVYVRGLAQWAYRLSITFGIIFAILYLMKINGRFPGL